MNEDSQGQSPLSRTILIRGALSRKFYHCPIDNDLTVYIGNYLNKSLRIIDLNSENSGNNLIIRSKTVCLNILRVKCLITSLLHSKRCTLKPDQTILIIIR